MQLPSRLEETTLGDLLGMVYRARLTGCLWLAEPSGRWHGVRFDSGRPTQVHTAFQAPRLGELLCGSGANRALRQAVERAALGGREPLGKALLKARLVTLRQLRGAVVAQTRARLDALFGLTRASIRFSLLGAPWVTIGTAPLGPEAFLHGRPRARRRCRAQVQTPLDVQRALGLLGLNEFPEAERELRRAFRMRAAELHPDRASSAERESRTRDFAELSAAYHLLVSRRAA